jgi:1-acyl-sn-glycerol-3-phosphate acyltransferase
MTPYRRQNRAAKITDFDITHVLTASMTRITQTLYGIYAWTVFVLLVSPTLIGVILVPGLRARRRLARAGARGVFWALGTPIVCRGAARLESLSCVVVANHASYLDGIVLTAALPPNFTFVIKSEMSRVPLASLLLRRLGSQFVTRHDARKRARAARRLVKAARGGDALVFFPEGTFRRQPGLLRFRRGAFSAARTSARPVVPVVIHGTRRMLPSENWLPRPARIHVEVTEPLHSHHFPNAHALADAARERILKLLGEPDRGG